MVIQELREALDLELENAHTSRREGNEGKARVCARRATGLAIRVHFEEMEESIPTTNTLRLLKWFADQPQFSDELRKAASRLTVHVTTGHNLPHQEDLLEDAKFLITAMLEESFERNQ
jgi:hypothetical protein